MRRRGRADLHMHTDQSDGWPSPEALVDYTADFLELDVIAITDHDTIAGAQRAAVYATGRRGAPHVVMGEEVSSRDGHIVGLFLERRVPPGLSAAATLEAIHEQGGLAFAAHPFWRTERRSRGWRVHGVGWLAADLEFDAVEVENATPGFYIFNQMAHRLVEGAGCAELGGSDAHILDAIGRAYTSFEGHTPKALRSAIAGRRTSAQREPYRASGLLRYAAWGIEHRRLRRAARAVS